MNHRRFGRAGWSVSEIGYGMWGMAGWSNSDDQQSLQSLQAAADLGCNFFDTAYAYGQGKSEGFLGEVVRTNTEKRLYTATKIPPKNLKWPALAAFTLDDCYPPDHIDEYVRKSLQNSSFDSFDLVQFHTWEDNWTEDGRWFEKMDQLRKEGLIGAVGISINRWEPWNGVKAVRSGMIDAVQVIYNIFDQNPEDQLFPACRDMDVAVIARVPFDEGTLTGTLTKDSKWPEGDWRNIYFVPENLIPSIDRVEKLQELLRDWNASHPADKPLTLPDLALRFILSNPDVSTIIPGMRKTKHVESNLAASDAGPLPTELLDELRNHRWVRKPAPWSD
jgi:aryl-alcohol dehydrogenase-like predicted oxidoreductase